MDRSEAGSLIALFFVYKIIIFLILFYEITKCKWSEMEEVLNIKDNSILLTILFVYFLHVTLYHCPEQNNVNQKEGKEGNQTGTSNSI